MNKICGIESKLSGAKQRLDEVDKLLQGGCTQIELAGAFDEHRAKGYGENEVSPSQSFWRGMNRLGEFDVYGRSFTFFFSEVERYCLAICK